MTAGVCGSCGQALPPLGAPAEAPEQPVKARPSPTWPMGSRPIAIGTVAEARRLLVAVGAVEDFDGQVYVLTLALERAYQTGRADALAAKEGK